MNINKVGSFTANVAKKAITQLGKPSALLPIALLEVTVDTGRAVQAKKRGGYTEMRERLTDDVSAGVFWLFGAKYLNKFGDYVGKKLFGIQNPVFSAGKDKARDGLKQSILVNSSHSATKLAAFKFSKVAISILAAVGFIGWILPKVNQAITRKLRGNSDNQNQNKPQNNVNINAKKIFEDFENYKKPKNKSKPSFGFKLSAETIGRFAHKLEHDSRYRLGATDGGILVGRTTNARTFDEGLEYGFRDAVSSYFYLAATGNIFSLMNTIGRLKVENGKIVKSAGNISAIDPSSAVHINNHLEKVLNGKKVSVENFEKLVLGKLDEKKFNLIKDTLANNDGNITVEDFCKLTKASKKLSEKAVLMSRLQPRINGVAILTDKQAMDVLTNGAITDPKFLYKTMNGYFGEATKHLFGNKKGKFSVSGIRDKLAFTSISDIESFKDKIVSYVKGVSDMATAQAKKNGGVAEVSLDLLKKASKKNALTHSTYLLTGLGVSALFLSTLIPKMQYWITKKRTGKDGFPGVQS